LWATTSLPRRWPACLPRACSKKAGRAIGERRGEREREETQTETHPSGKKQKGKMVLTCDKYKEKN